MPEEISVIEDLQIIKIVSHGQVTIQELQKTFKKVLKIRQTRGLRRVLADATGQTAFASTYPLFKFGSDMTKQLKGMIFAIAASPHTRDDLFFLETVVHNRGGLIAMFDSVDEALAWLMEKPDKLEPTN